MKETVNFVARLDGSIEMLQRHHTPAGEIGQEFSLGSFHRGLREWRFVPTAEGKERGLKLGGGFRTLAKAVAHLQDALNREFP